MLYLIKATEHLMEHLNISINKSQNKYQFNFLPSERWNGG